MEGFLCTKQNCLFLVVLFTIFVNARGFGFGQEFCEGVTVDDCNIDERNPKAIKATISLSKEQCQAICNAETDCAVFRWEKQTGQCSRFDKDYRQECISGGGPADHSIATCLGTALNSCDEFLEEDCTYDMLKDDSTIPSHPVAEPQHCQEECQSLYPICKYWVYQNKTCYLLKSGERNCSVISGPKFPNIDTCPFANNNETTSTAPSTTTTKIDKTSTITPTKFQTTLKTTSTPMPTTKQQEATTTTTKETTAKEATTRRTTQTTSTTWLPPTTTNKNIASSTVQPLTTTSQSKTPKTTTVAQLTTEVESTTTDANVEKSTTQILTSTTESSDITETQDGSTMTTEPITLL